VLYVQAKWDNHLFLHCEIARDLWSSLCNLFGVDWVILRIMRVIDELRRSGKAS
jgi:hypothetical protein